MWLCMCVRQGMTETVHMPKHAFIFLLWLSRKAAFSSHNWLGLSLSQTAGHSRRWPQGAWAQIPGCTIFLAAHPPEAPWLPLEVARPPGLLCCLGKLASVAKSLVPEWPQSHHPDHRTQGKGTCCLFPVTLVWCSREATKSRRQVQLWGPWVWPSLLKVLFVLLQDNLSSERGQGSGSQSHRPRPPPENSCSRTVASADWTAVLSARLQTLLPESMVPLLVASRRQTHSIRAGRRLGQGQLRDIPSS